MFLIGIKAAFPSGDFRMRDPKNKSFPADEILSVPICRQSATRVSAAFSSDKLNKVKTKESELETKL